MSLPDCPYFQPTAPANWGFCKAGIPDRAADTDLMGVDTFLIAGACCCMALLITEHCPEGWR